MASGQPEQAFIMAVPLRNAAGIFSSISRGRQSTAGRGGRGSGGERRGRGSGGERRGRGSGRSRVGQMGAAGRGSGSAVQGRGRGHGAHNQSGRRSGHRSTGVQPKFKEFHLIGESIISKLGQFCSPPVWAEYSHDVKGKTLGALVVHGQTTSQLLRRLGFNYNHIMNENCAVLIGTNDLLKGVPRETTMEAIDKIITLLSEVALTVVVMTLPPIPKLLARNEQHLEEVKALNRHIGACTSAKDNVHIFDLHQVMMNGDVINETLFQKTYRSGMEDNIHPNIEGNIAIKEGLSEFIDILLS